MLTDRVGAVFGDSIDGRGREVIAADRIERHHRCCDLD
jgi:hypothetical protein